MTGGTCPGTSQQAGPPAAASTAPVPYVTAGPAASQSAPAMTLTSSSIRPVTRLKTPCGGPAAGVVSVATTEPVAAGFLVPSLPAFRAASPDRGRDRRQSAFRQPLAARG